MPTGKAVTEYLKPRRRNRPTKAKFLVKGLDHRVLHIGINVSWSHAFA